MSLRPYQAPTCLDHDLAFLAVNMAQVKQHDFVYDPFVGSASTLISAAHFGAVTFGSDLDLRVILGSSVGRKAYDPELTESVIKKAEAGSAEAQGQFNMFTNFRHYGGLSMPEVFAQDILHPALLQRPIFDAIICDPPYGVKVCSRKAGDNHYFQK